jgi:ABC-type transporter MlaC component
MTDRTREEHTMKRTATILGVAAALVFPAAASAGNISTQVKPQVKTQVVAQVVQTQVVAQRVRPHVVAQVVAQRVNPAVTAQRVTSVQARIQRFSLIRLAR